MKKQILMLSALAMFMITSCSKSKDEPKEEMVVCQLTQASLSGNGETITHSYEFKDGKITFVKAASDKVSHPLNYSYNHTSTSISEGETMYTLDAQGRITSESGPENIGRYNKTYVYNNDGYLIEVKKDNTNDITKFTWTNGNLTKIEEVVNYDGTAYSDITFYDYSSDIRPTNFYADVPDMPVVYNYIFKFMGKQTKNLVSKERYEIGTTGNMFIYGFDSNKNVTSMTDKDETSGFVNGAYEFKYSCK